MKFVYDDIHLGHILYNHKKNHSHCGHTTMAVCVSSLIPVLR